MRCGTSGCAPGKVDKRGCAPDIMKRVEVLLALKLLLSERRKCRRSTSFHGYEVVAALVDCLARNGCLQQARSGSMDNEVMCMALMSGCVKFGATSWYRQIGNAVAPPVVRAIGESIMRCLAQAASLPTKTAVCLVEECICFVERRPRCRCNVDTEGRMTSIRYETHQERGISRRSLSNSASTAQQTQHKTRCP